MPEDILDELDEPEVKEDRSYGKSFGVALRIFKKLGIIFSIIVWVVMIADDWNLIKNHWPLTLSQFLTYLGIWMAYFVAFFVFFAMSFWSCSVLLIVAINRRRPKK